jgi:AraC-like DNA-binding protein
MKGNRIVLTLKALKNLLVLIPNGRSRVLGRQLVREIIYRILMGQREPACVRWFGGHFSQLSRTLQRIHDEYPTPVGVVELAREAGMSLSVFHLRFKQMTSTSPAQYIKAIRLHSARSMMFVRS